VKPDEYRRARKGFGVIAAISGPKRILPAQCRNTPEP